MKQSSPTFAIEALPDCFAALAMMKVGADGYRRGNHL